MLAQLGMIGVTFRRGGQARVAQFTLPVADREAHLTALHEACGFVESVYLATCNRVEILYRGQPGVCPATYRERVFAYFGDRFGDSGKAASLGVTGVAETGSISTTTSGSGSGSGAASPAAQALHAYGEDGAVERLFCVAAALDSMNPGEAQVLGQVKQSYRAAVALGHVGPALTAVFEAAFQAAKRVRCQTSLGAGSVSMMALAMRQLEAHLALAAPLPRQPRVALVGTGTMLQQCAQQLCGSASLLFVNRTLSGAQALADGFADKVENHDGDTVAPAAMALDAFLMAPPPVDVLVTATAAPGVLFGASYFDSCSKSRRQAGAVGALLVVDLAIPRDVDPEAAKASGAVLLDIDGLQTEAQRNRQARQDVLATAREVVDDALAATCKRLAARDMSTVVAALRQCYAATTEASLRELDVAFSDEQQGLLRRWAQTLTNRLAHVPTVGLKHVGYACGTEAVDAFVEGAGQALQRHMEPLAERGNRDEAGADGGDER